MVIPRAAPAPALISKHIHGFRAHDLLPPRKQVREGFVHLGAGFVRLGLTADEPFLRAGGEENAITQSRLLAGQGGSGVRSLKAGEMGMKDRLLTSRGLLCSWLPPQRHCLCSN